MPRIPPTAERITEENEKKSAPHNAGIYPPIVEPITIPIIITDFEFMR